MLPSLAELSVKPWKKEQRKRKGLYLREPIAQNVALGLFRMASGRELKGFYGAVRQLNLHKARLHVGRRGITDIAIKKSDVTTENRMQVTYNEYLMHRAVYACIELAHPSAIVYFTYPFEMTIPCERVRPESRSEDVASIAAPAPGMTIALPEEVDDEESDESDEESDSEELLTTSCDSSSGYVYTIQSWGCSRGEISKSLDDVYDRLTPEALSTVGRDVGRALWCLHSCQYMHNDLALRNILVCYTPTQTRAMMLDFGIAKRELAPLSEENFWLEMRQCILDINNRQGYGGVWWKPWRAFLGRSVFVDAAFLAWSDSFNSFNN